MQRPSEPNTSENPSALRAPPLLAPSPIPLVEWSLIVNRSLPHDKLIQLPDPISESFLMSSDSSLAIVAGRQHGPKSIRESFHFQTHSASIPISLAQLILGSVALRQDDGTLATINPACRIHAQPLLLQIRGHYATSPDFCNGARGFGALFASCWAKFGFSGRECAGRGRFLIIDSPPLGGRGEGSRCWGRMCTPFCI